MRSSFGAGFPLFATAMYKHLGVRWASSTLGFLSIAFIPIPFALYKVRKFPFSLNILNFSKLPLLDATDSEAVTL